MHQKLEDFEKELRRFARLIKTVQQVRNAVKRF